MRTIRLGAAALAVYVVPFAYMAHTGVTPLAFVLMATGAVTSGLMAARLFG